MKKRLRTAGLRFPSPSTILRVQDRTASAYGPTDRGSFNIQRKYNPMEQGEFPVLRHRPILTSPSSILETYHPKNSSNGHPRNVFYNGVAHQLAVPVRGLGANSDGGDWWKQL